MSIPDLPTGYKFLPEDSHLLYYLKEKLLGYLDNHLAAAKIQDNIDPYSCDPVKLPKGDDFKESKEAYFFINKQESRTVKDGFWRASTSPEEIFDEEGQMVGFKKDFVFYWSIKKKKIKTRWTMHEYNVNPAIFSDDQRKDIGNKIENHIVCRLEYKSVEYSSSDEELEDSSSDDEESE